MDVRIWTIKRAAAAKSLRLCPTLCDPIDSSPPGSPVPGIIQARTLEWVTISFSNVGKWKVKVKSLSCVQLLAIPWTAVYQAPPSMGFSRQEYWSGVPLPSPRGRVGWPIRVQLFSGRSVQSLMQEAVHEPSAVAPCQLSGARRQQTQRRLSFRLDVFSFVGTATAKSLQLCPTLCNPIDGSPPGSRPWDSPGKNTGVGCHFLLQYVH